MSLASSGSTFLRFGSSDLSSFRKTPALICSAMKLLLGTTMS